MTQQDTANRIQDVLRRLPKDEFHTVAQDLLEMLGYRSQRTLATTGDPADLFGNQQEQELLDEAVSARIVFQVTEEEIKEITASGQLSLIDTGGFDDGNVSSFLFITVALKEPHYTRGRYVKFTREINKRFSMPTAVLFKTAPTCLPSLSCIAVPTSGIRTATWWAAYHWSARSTPMPTGCVRTWTFWETSRWISG